MQITDKYKRFVLGMLFVIFTLNFLDRQLMAILAEPIKLEFALSDAQLGLLTGIAFAIFYTALGFPMARWADRGDRVFILAASLFVWSIFTTLTGFASGFWSLFVMRIGVGIGEAGCGPAAYSLIADYFSKSKRGKAMSVYMLGIPVGVFLGFIMGGLIAKHLGWRNAFFIAGVPGVLLALFLRRAIFSIPRGHSDNLNVETSQLPVMASLRHILGTRSFAFLSLGAGAIALVAYGVGNFFASFLQRSHNLDLQTAGIALAFLYIVGGGSGLLLSGALADRLGHRAILIPFCAALLLIPCSLGCVVAPNLPSLFVAIFFTNFFGGLYLAPAVVAVSQVTHINERSFAAAIFLFVVNFMGLGLGPMFVGLMSDLFRNSFITSGTEPVLANSEGLRYAILTTIPFLVLAACCFYLAKRTFKDDIKS